MGVRDNWEVQLRMKYIIADPDKKSHFELKNILDEIDILDVQGSCMTLDAAENSIRIEPPDIVFIKMGKAKLNAFKLMGLIREQNLTSKVIVFSNYAEDAVQAFEYEADGFLLAPFKREQVERLVQRYI